MKKMHMHFLLPFFPSWSIIDKIRKISNEKSLRTPRVYASLVVIMVVVRNTRNCRSILGLGIKEGFYSLSGAVFPSFIPP